MMTDFSENAVQLIFVTLGKQSFYCTVSFSHGAMRLFKQYLFILMIKNNVVDADSHFHL